MVKTVICLEEMGGGLEAVPTICVTGEKAGFVPYEK
jgi:hypothetical protein